jgi:membrane fusion protein (multidrug efflux system)
MLFSLPPIHCAAPVSLRAFLCAAALALLAGCNKPPATPPARPAEVTAITITPKDTPVSFEFVAQTQSSREVEIRARVSGFLDKRLYTEGAPVRAGQVMFQMDRKPFEAALQTAKGQLDQQQARLSVATQALARVRPLALQNAVSKKDLDDAIGNVQQAQAAVFAADGEVTTAQLNLSYTTIASPLAGLSSFARRQEGSFLTPGEGGLLTYVAQIDPMWVNFSMSENELLKYRGEVEKGRLMAPANREYDVEVILADGTVYPKRGRINFIDPSFSKETGTFLIRTVIANPEGLLRPGQFVRARVMGSVRPRAILVPRRAVLQGAKSHYVWIIDKEGKARERSVETGDWQGDDWFISNGLLAGERVVVDGAIRVSPGSVLKIVQQPAAAAAAAPAPAGSAPAGTAPAGAESAANGPGKSPDQPAR